MWKLKWKSDKNEKIYSFLNKLRDKNKLKQMSN